MSFRRLILLALLGVVAACGYPDPGTPVSGPVAGTATLAPSPSASANGPGPDFNAGSGLPVHTLPDGLKYIDIRVGTGAAPNSMEDTVTVNYTGWTSDGTKFDSSFERGQPADFPLNGVVPGFGEGILSMRIGGERKLIIPAKLGYADQPPQGSGIPPNATLIFVVDLLNVKAPAPSPSP